MGPAETHRPRMIDHPDLDHTAANPMASPALDPTTRGLLGRRAADGHTVIDRQDRVRMAPSRVIVPTEPGRAHDLTIAPRVDPMIGLTDGLTAPRVDRPVSALVATDHPRSEGSSTASVTAAVDHARPVGHGTVTLGLEGRAVIGTVATAPLAPARR